ncbi:hypothetical protein Xbed_00412 [Xenorhabdus beddingii]|uniref:Uncharacterized protein n=1 Tax=Xenorhabdus beddingii TaxID=40578 RepID=A0A1Y2SRB9_9GAMM|nr:hypothetical protein [Xenorhabdus beddingii]OTA21662.1 hypothetical protein Xbed_00412 [Xenorhabdus beddingii]
MREIFYKSVIHPANSHSMSSLEIQFRDLIIDASRYLIKSVSPDIIHHFNIDDNNTYYKFVSWCYKHHEHTDWRIGLSLIKYFNKTNVPVGIKIKEELLFLSCSQWTYMNKSKKITILILYGEINNKLFGAKKSTQADQFREVFYIEIDKNNYPIGNHDFLLWELQEDDDIPKCPENKNER